MRWLRRAVTVATPISPSAHAVSASTATTSLTRSGVRSISRRMSPRLTLRRPRVPRGLLVTLRGKPGCMNTAKREGADHLVPRRGSVRRVRPAVVSCQGGPGRPDQPAGPAPVGDRTIALDQSGHDGVDPIRTGEVLAGEQECEGEPAAEPDDRRAGHVPGCRGVAVGQHLPVLVDRVDSVLTGRIPAGEQEREGEPAAEPDDHRTRYVAVGGLVTVGQQPTVLVD